MNEPKQQLLGIVQQIIREGKAMKILSVALLLMACLAFVLLGCSDNSAPIVAPTDQAAQAPASLQKSTNREFTATMVPTGVISIGVTKSPDGKLTIRHMLQTIYFDVKYPDGRTDIPDLLTGDGVLEINLMADYAAGTGDSWGNCTLSREKFGGEWKFTWHGKSTLGPSGWIIPLQEIGHGNGGDLTGIQVIFDHTITAATDLSGWSGAGTGYLKSH